MGIRLDHLVALGLALLALASGAARADDACEARAEALQTRLTVDAGLLGLCHPDVDRVVGRVEPARLQLPIYRDRIEGTWVVVDREGRAKVAGTDGWIDLSGDGLQPALEKVISTSNRSYIDIDRWQPAVRRAFEAIPIDTGTAVVIDGRALSGRAVQVLSGLAEAAGDRLGRAPAERPAVWFWIASRKEVVREVPKAWQTIPHYVPLTQGGVLVKHIEDAPERHVVEPTGGLQVMGSLDKLTIRRLLQGQRAPLRSCLAYALRDGVDLDTEVEAKLVVGPNGRVRAAKLIEGRVGHPDTEACLLAALGSIPFPTCCGGMLIIRQAFVVRSKPGPAPGGPH